MLHLYENKKQSVWSRIQQDCDIDELIYGTTQVEDVQNTEDTSDR